jgi:hypothetical protein
LVAGFGLGWSALAELAVDTAMVVPVDVFGNGDLDIAN